MLLKAISYINKKFDKLAAKHDLNFVVEKTCANSLQNIETVLPDCKYIFIARNGIDVTASAKLRWKSKFDIKYTLKLRYVPVLIYHTIL